MSAFAQKWRFCLVLTGIVISADAQEFEVATVKPSAAMSLDPNRAKAMAMLFVVRPPGLIEMVDPGRVRMTNYSLLDLIAAAWRVRATRLSGPGWMADQRFDVEAKVPDGTPRGQVNEMLQALLAERFGLRLHQETRTLSGFALVAAKSGPKLKIPEPVVPTSQLPFPVPKPPSDLRRGGSHFHFTRMTMESLCNFLSTKTNGPVIDMTGLTEQYDIELETWPDTPDDPGVTIFEAVERLGLKLESRKVPIETLVVDQVAKTPAAN